MGKSSVTPCRAADRRLGIIDALLAEAGWRQEPRGWLGPARLRERLSMTVGLEHQSRATAMAIQMEDDEEIIRQASDPAYE